MVAALTADAFLTRVNTRALLPAADDRLSSVEKLAIADDCIASHLGLEVYDAGDGRWVFTAPDVALTVGVSDYRIPSRAWAGAVSTVELVDSTGCVTPLEYVDRAEVPEYGGALVYAAPAYAIVGDALRIVPTPTTTGYSLRVGYVRRPSALALVADCVLLTNVSGTVLTGTLPTAYTSDPTVDIVRGSPLGTALEDDVATADGSGTLTRSIGTFATTGALAVAAGDYACLAGTTCVLQVPDVAVSYLVDLTVREVCRALGDSEGASSAANAAEQSRTRMVQAMARRSRTAPRVVNWGSPLRSGAGGTRSRLGWGLR